MKVDDFFLQFSIENIIRSDEDNLEGERREEQIRLAFQYHQIIQHYLQQSWTTPGRVMEVRPMLQHDDPSNRSVDDKRQKVRRVERKPRQAYSAKQLERLEAEFQVSSRERL